MNIEVLIKPQPEPVPKLDRTSERYRICGECETEFMATHLSRKFCRSKCKNDFNNRHKRFIKDAQKTTASENFVADLKKIEPVIPQIDFNRQSADLIKKNVVIQGPTIGKIVIPEQKESEDEIPANVFDTNLKSLEKKVAVVAAEPAVEKIAVAEKMKPESENPLDNLNDQFKGVMKNLAAAREVAAAKVVASDSAGTDQKNLLEKILRF